MAHTGIDANDINHLKEWNDTQQDYPDICIGKLLDKQASATPTAIALVDEHQQITYRALQQTTNCWANYLNQLGLVSGDVIGVYSNGSVDAIIAMLAIFKVGAVYLPIDIKQAPSKVNQIINDAQPQLLICADHISQLNIDTICEIITYKRIKQELVYFSSDNHSQYSNIDSPSYIIYTSGTSGKPKGVVNIQRGTVNQLLWLQQQFKLTSDDSILQKTSLGFDVSIWEILWPLTTGARLVLARAGVKYDAEKLVDSLVKHDISVVYFSPSQLSALITSKDISVCCKIRLVIMGSEVLQYDLYKRLQQSLPNADIYNLYGPSEASIDVSYYKCGEHTSGHSIMPIGKPITNTRFYVLDDNKDLVSINTEGELHIAGNGLAQGYLNDHSLTEEKFINIKGYYNNNERVYATGDIVKWSDDGNLYFIGRRDRQVKVNGVRIECQEIESILLAHPDVVQAVVTARIDKQNKTNLVAYLVSEQVDSRPSELGLRQYCAEYLMDYSIPANWCWLEQIPLNHAGKCAYEQLPDPEHEANKGKIKLAQSHLQWLLLALWKDVLDVKDISLDSNYFSLGGDSLGAMVIASRLANNGVRVNPAWVLKFPCIRKLSKEIAVSIVVGEQAQQSLEKEHNGPGFPLTAMQQGMLFHIMQKPHVGVYLDQIQMKIKGELDTTLFKRAWDTLLAKHDALRIGFFVTQYDKPRQIVDNDCKLNYEYHDISNLDVNSQQSLINEQSNSSIIKGFDFVQAPLWSVKVYRTLLNEYLLVYTDQHAISDGITQGNIFHEVFQVYSDLCLGKHIIAEKVYKYQEYCQWIESQDKEKAKEYWSNCLKSIDGPTVIGIDKHVKHSCAQSDLQDSHSFTLKSDEVNRLNSIARKNQVSFNTLIQATWGILLARYCRDDNICYGLIESGRHINLPHIENRIGAFTVTYPVVQQFNEHTTIESMLTILQQQLIHSSECSYLSLYEIQSQSAVPTHIPILRYAITFPGSTVENICDELSNISNLELGISNRYTKAHFLMTATVMVVNGEADISLCFDKAHFNEDDIYRLSVHWKNIINNTIKNQTQPVMTQDMLTAEEYYELVHKYNYSHCDYPRDLTVVDLFEQQAAKQKHKIAIVYNNETISYEQLNIKANQLAWHLRDAGVVPEDRIVIHFDRSIEFIICILGVLKAGAAYVPIDIIMPSERVNYMIDDCNAKYVITSADKKDLITKPCMVYENIVDELDKRPKNNLPRLHTPDNAIYIIYTSGTTGKPKGVIIEHHSLVHLLFACDEKFSFTEDDVWSCSHLFNFDFSVWEVFGSFYNGARLILISYDTLLNEKYYRSIIIDNKVTILSLTPSFLSRVINENDSKHACLDNEEFSYIRYIIAGGENLTQISMCCLNRIKKLKKIKFVNMFGITETTVHLFCKQIIPDMILDKEYSLIGKPLKGVNIYIQDKYMNPVPYNVHGELVIGGETLARCYLYEHTIKQFDYYNKYNDRVYKTGDIVKINMQNEIHYLGREDHQVKLRGYRLELDEIKQAFIAENNLYETEILMENIQGHNQLTAYILIRHTVGKSEIHEDIVNIINNVRKKLPIYMIPGEIRTVVKWPMSRNGKLDINLLRHNSVVFMPVFDCHDVFYSTLEKNILKLFIKILETNTVTVNDDFFLNGGHSLKILQLVCEIQRCTSVKIPMSTLFYASTPSALAKHIHNQQKSYKNQTSIA